MAKPLISREKQETLLSRFIMEKIDKYIEPQRRGIARGEKVGLSLDKYIASLFMLYNMKQKEMAEKIGISHGLLRKWNTEEDFQTMVLKHCEEFAEIVCKYLKEKVKKCGYQYAAILKKPMSEIPHSKIISDYSEVSDAGVYGPVLALILVQKLFHIKDIDLAMAMDRFFLFELMKGGRKSKLDKEVRKARVELARRFEKTLLEKVRDVLMDSNASEEQRKDAVFGLTAIIDTIGEK
jgi:transcriptional regulator with XRE-family HTH domain